ncbi:putative polygalacturonase [Dendrobium catenatum]|uniref:Putative polygalacturonase n=1 Tax=Dendrobium catenatum TaxID=906689 RepID=A0A2I0WS56_9ASPA|nr:putative polygalacturonase [Dendrobium catenatum]
MRRVGKGVRIAGDVGDHPDDKFNPEALLRVDGVTIRNVWGVGVKEAGSIEGIKGSPFTRICLWNVKLWGIGRQMEAWKCAAVSGVAVGVQPWPCGELTGIMSTSEIVTFLIDRKGNQSSSKNQDREENGKKKLYSIN